MSAPPFAPTDEQRAIIEHPATPLRVAAGAGTGKTTTIVRRLAAGVERGGDPARALGITFTNKAARELRARLTDIIGARPDGREPEVSTYHGFAANLLDEFGRLIGYAGGSAIMDEGHRSELAIRVLRSLEHTTLDLTALNHRRDDLLTVVGALDDHLLDTDAVRSVAPEVIDDVWVKRLALLDAADRYRTLKDELGVIEYSDLIRGAVRIVDEHPDVAATVRSRYDIVLLDEYQDTDPAQRRLLTTLFADATPVTAVGDADQTIYEWRGASIENFEQFPTDFPEHDGSPADTLPLSINRRSDALIIETANAIRAHLPASSGSTDLRPGPDAGQGSVVAAFFPTEEEEARWIASDIAARHDAGTPYAEIAILSRKREGLRPIAAVLKEAEIPFVVSSMGELLSVPEVADLVAWLRIVAEPRDEGALMRILLGGRYRLGMGDVAAITRVVPRVAPHGLIDAILADTTEEAPSPGATAQHASPAIDLAAILDDRAATSVASFARTYRRLLAHSQAASVMATAEAVVAELDYWSEIAALGHAAAVTARINVSRFLDVVGRWHPLDGSATITAFLRYLDALDESGRADELDAAVTTTEDAVQLLTVHAAKGLEWDEVYLPALSKGIFPSDIRLYHDPADSATAIPYHLRLDAEAMRDVEASPDRATRRRLLKLRHDAQEWRLAYVASTRARRTLVATGHAWHGDNRRPKAPSDLLRTIRAVDGVVSEVFCDDPGERPAPMPVIPRVEPPDPSFEDGWGAALRQTIEDPGWIRRDHPELADDVERRAQQFTLELGDLELPGVEPEPEVFSTSVTALVALAECPLRFRWLHHDRLPRRPRTSAVLGTAFHRRVELHNLGIATLEEASIPSPDDTAGPDDITVQGGGRRGDPWQSFQRSRFASDRPFLVETPFEITLDGRRLRGKVDAVYGDERSWEIVDYKSGAPTPSDAKAVQLQAYAVAADRGLLTSSRPEDLTVTFAYFGTEPAETFTRRVDQPWLDTAVTTVSQLLATAETGPFEPEPSASCRWCDFLHLCDAGQAHLADASTEPSSTSMTNVTGPSLTN